MINSIKGHYYQCDGSLPCCKNNDVAEASTDDSLKGGIPARYLDERGGMDLERVRLDQREARRQVVRAMIRSIKELWHRR
ncbi:hypothetical protein [Nitrincola sp. A-D6]|uniref:hypothetical protein n=1 Tax=Nitrincola sp. A-D6 TaxID=1545442 RepID=UPI001186BD1B|nr:hypothetical protein [Nitrincola sp. A-D6]